MLHRFQEAEVQGDSTEIGSLCMYCKTACMKNHVYLYAFSTVTTMRKVWAFHQGAQSL